VIETRSDAMFILVCNVLIIVLGVVCFINLGVAVYFLRKRDHYNRKAENIRRTNFQG